MPDRELLEAAARAAGIKVGNDADSEARALSGPGLWFHDDARKHPMCRKPNRPGNVPWNPLTDDGDALRLAVKLRLTINPYTDGLFVSRDAGEPVIAERWASDKAETTRRAIVRLAAEIGRAEDGREKK